MLVPDIPDPRRPEIFSTPREFPPGVFRDTQCLPDLVAEEFV